jgi:methanethiol S-methyltransferase
MRAFGILFGVGTQALFLLTVGRLFLFLLGNTSGLLTGDVLRRLWPAVDTGLAFHFAILHSWLLLPRTQKRLKQIIAPTLYGCFFSAVTCVSLLLTFEIWQPSSRALWDLHGPGRTVMIASYLVAWAALVYSLSLTGLGYQTGLTSWWAWVRGRPATRRWSAPRGPYRWLRHPAYLSFLGLVWLTPTMTLDRAILTAVWTVYIFVGSHLKDRRLELYVGDDYRHYQARVPGYPFFLWGPLGKVSIRQARARTSLPVGMSQSS